MPPSDIDIRIRAILTADIDQALGKAKELMRQLHGESQLTGPVTQQIAAATQTRIKEEYPDPSQDLRRRRAEHIAAQELEEQARLLGLETAAIRLRWRGGPDASRRAINPNATAARDRLEGQRNDADIYRRIRADTSPADIQQQARDAVDIRRLAALKATAIQEELRSPVGQQAGLHEVQNRVDQRELQAVQAEMLAEDKKYIEATARAANAKQEEAALVTLARSGQHAYKLDATGAPTRELLDRNDLLAKAAVTKQTEENRYRAAVAKQTLESEQSLRAAVELRAEESRLREAIKEREISLTKAAIDEGKFGGTRFQRLQARNSAGDRAPTEFQTLGQFVGQKLTTTAGYAVAGAIEGGLTYGLVNALQESEKLQQTFARLQDQLNALGRGGEFTGIRAQIKDIAKETGQSADEVARFASQLIGVFNDPQRAITETASAMKLAVISGEDLGTLSESLVPIMKGFGVSVEQIGDAAVGAQVNFGLSESAFIKFAGTVAPVAQDLGLSLQEVQTIGGVVSQSLGVNLDTAAGSITRALPQLEKVGTTIASIYRQEPGTADLASPLLRSLGAGDLGSVLDQIVRSYGRLSKSQRDALITTLATRRETSVFIALLQNADKVIDGFSNAEQNAAQQSGGMERRFQSMSETLTNAGERIKQTFLDIAESLYQSGFSDFFQDMANTVQAVLGPIGALVNLISALNGLTKNISLPVVGDLAATSGFVTPIIEALAVWGLLAKAISYVTGLKKVESETNLETAGTEAAEAGARQGNVAVLGEESGALDVNTVAKGENALAGRGGGIPAYGAAGQVQTMGGAAEVGGETAATGGFLSKFGSKFGASSGDFLGGGGGLLGQVAGLGAVAIADFAITKTVADNKADELAKQGDELDKQIKAARTDQLQAVLDQGIAANVDFNDRVTSAMFGKVPGAQERVERELGARKFTGASDQIKDIYDSGQAAQFASTVSAGNLDILNRSLNVDGASQKFATEVLGIGRSDETGEVGVTNENFKNVVKNAQQRFAATGDLNAGRFLQFITEIYRTENDLKPVRDTVQKYLDDRNTKAAEAAATAAGTNLGAHNIAERNAQYEAGERTIGQHINDLRENISYDKDLLAGAGADDALRSKYADQLRKDEKDLNDSTIKSIDARAEAIKASAGLSGSRTVNADQLRLRLSTLQGLPQNEQLEQLPKLLDATNATFKENLDNTADLMQRSALALQGPQVDPQVQKLFAIQQLSSNTAVEDIGSQLGTALPGDYTDTTGKVVQRVGLDIEKFNTDVSQIVIDEKKTILEAVIQEIDRQIEDLYSNQTGPSGNQANRDKIAKLREIRQRALDSIPADTALTALQPGPDYKAAFDAQEKSIRGAADKASAVVAGDPVASAKVKLRSAQDQYGVVAQRVAHQLADSADLDSAEAAVIEGQTAVSDALDAITLKSLEWGVVLANGDPVAENAARMQIAQQTLAIALRKSGGTTDNEAVIAAQQEIQKLQFQAIDNQNAQTRAALELQATVDARDPFKAALDQLHLAQFNLSVAKPGADTLQAQSQVLKAQQSIEDYIKSVLQSQVDLAVAVAEAAGDSVGAAQIAFDSAQAKLNEALKEGRDPNGAEVNGLRQEAVTKGAALRDATLAEKERHIEFLQQMGQLTTDQVIAAYQSLLAYPGATQSFIEEVTLKIHELQQTAKQDYQFNLPSNINLPTFYEARRASQTPGGPGAYTDNRQVAVNINVTNSNDLAAVEASLAEHLGSNRYAPFSKRY